MHVIELPLSDIIVEGWLRPGATPPSPGGLEDDRMMVEPPLLGGVAKPGELSLLGGKVVLGVCPGVILGFPPPPPPGGLLSVNVLPWFWPGDVGLGLGSPLLGVGAQVVSTPGTHELKPLGTFVDWVVISCSGLLCPVGFMLALVPVMDVVVGRVVLPLEGAELRLPPRDVLEPRPWPGATAPPPSGVELELIEGIGVFVPGLLGEVVAVPPGLLGVRYEFGLVGGIPSESIELDPPLFDEVGGAL